MRPLLIVGIETENYEFYSCLLPALTNRAIRHAMNFKHSLESITDDDKYGSLSVFLVFVYLSNRTVIVDCNTTIPKEPIRIAAL